MEEEEEFIYMYIYDK